MFRWPKDDPARNREYYASRYTAGGLVTETPADRELESLLASGFRGSRHDFSPYIRALTSVCSEGHILDFGASWGYGTWQLERAGYSAVGCEVDLRRVKFGRQRLGLDLVSAYPSRSDTKELPTAQFPDGSFDILFTTHTLEHLPVLDGLLGDFRRILRPRGILMVVVPNCEGIENPEVFDRKRSFAFGEVHTLAFDSEFWARNLPLAGFEVLCLTTDVGPLQPPKESVEVEADELMVIGKARE